MPKIDLITGFLGSGKTTFLKQYARHLMAQGSNIGILENDFGAVNVDMMLLGDLEGDNCELEMVAGGCDIDCHRRRFKTKLIAMGMVGYDRVLVEPSGIYDVDEFFDVLYEEPLDAWYTISSVIAIVDAKLEEELSEEAEYLLASQIADAGKVVLSRVQQASAQEMAATVAHLNRVMERFGCRRRFCLPDESGTQNGNGCTVPGDEAKAAFDMVLAKPWDELTPEDLKQLTEASWKSEDHLKLPVERENGFTSLYYMNHQIAPDQMRKLAEELFATPACGHIFRIKGFLKDAEGGWLQLNATREAVHIEKVSAGQEVIIVIGEALEQEVIDRLLHTAETDETIDCT